MSVGVVTQIYKLKITVNTDIRPSNCRHRTTQLTVHEVLYTSDNILTHCNSVADLGK